MVVLPLGTDTQEQRKHADVWPAARCLPVALPLDPCPRESVVSASCSPPRHQNQPAHYSHVNSNHLLEGHATKARSIESAMSLENLLPLGEANRMEHSGADTNYSRAHRQMRGFADLGHYERRER
jgi:hypothetical protein